MEDIDFFKLNNKNKNTSHSTNTWINRYKVWAVENNFRQDLENADAVSMNGILEHFFAKVNKLDGKNYEPTSLGNMQAGIQRHLTENGVSFSLHNDLEFKGSRDVIEGRARHLRQDVGLGRKPNRSRSLTLTDEEELWNSRQLGEENARALQNSMWYLLTQHLGLRGRQEHYDMKVEDFIINTNDNGEEYVTFSEGMTKTRQGGTKQKQRLVCPKMFTTGGPRCPVNIFKIFLQRRPEELRKTGPFYLAVIDKPKTDVWYKASKLGVNSIDSIMKKMVSKTEALSSGEKRLTNHSARNTVIRKLKKAKVPRTEIIGVTGHTRPEGLDPYLSGDEDEQRDLSHIISGHVPPSSSTITKPPVQEATAACSSSDTVTQPSYNKIVTDQSGSLCKCKSAMPPRSFNFFSSDEEYKMLSGGQTVMNFDNCKVQFFGDNRASAKGESVTRKRRKYIIESDSTDSSQDI